MEKTGWSLRTLIFLICVGWNGNVAVSRILLSCNNFGMPAKVRLRDSITAGLQYPNILLHFSCLFDLHNGQRESVGKK